MLNAPIVREAVKCANVITITGGGNDLINAAKEFLINKTKNVYLMLLSNQGKTSQKY